MRNYLFFISILFFGFSFAQTMPDTLSYAYSTGLSISMGYDSSLPLFEPWDGIEVDIPKEVRLDDFVPEVRNQGTAENSGGWAVGYYLASTEWALITNQSNKAMITTFAYDPLHLNAEAGEDNNPCGGEVYLPNLFQQLVFNGAKRMHIDPSNCQQTASFNKEQSLLDFVEIQRLSGLDTPSEKDVLSIKYTLATYHPVVFSMRIPESFEYVAKDGLFRPSERERQRTTLTRTHALTIVGFDDHLFGGAFRVVNSWGEEWGDEGYGWISYEDFQIFHESSYMVYTELKVPDLVAYGADQNGFGRKHIKKHGFFEGFLDAKGRPDKGIYMNEGLKKGRGGSRYMERLVKRNGGFLVYSKTNFDVPIAAVIY
jgi:hypothetical protein